MILGINVKGSNVKITTDGTDRSLKVVVDGKEVEHVMSVEIPSIGNQDRITTVKIEQYCNLCFEGKCQVEVNKVCPVRDRELSDDEIKRLAAEIQKPMTDALLELVRTNLRVQRGLRVDH